MAVYIHSLKIYSSVLGTEFDVERIMLNKTRYISFWEDGVAVLFFLLCTTKNPHIVCKTNVIRL